MTNPTPHGQVPEELRLAALLDADEWPGSMSLVSYARACVAELLRLHAENQVLRTTHVQSPTENEHVAGDVWKNGVKLNMSTQQTAAGATPECLTCSDHGAVGNILTAEPCPDCTRLSAQPAPATLAVNDDLRDRLVAISEAIADQNDRAAQAMLREILKAPQPSPTAQAAPTPVLHLVQDAFAEVAMAYPKAFALHKVGLADTAVRKALATTTAQAAPAYKDSTPELHIGDSAFESWYSTYSPVHKSDKQRARDAYAAGMGDPLVTAAPTTQPSPTIEGESK